MKELIASIDSLLAQIAPAAAIKESLEWYLSNNLSDYKSALKGQPSSREIDNATRALSRFCTESMDWDNPLYKTCCDITARGMKLAK